MTQRSRSLLHLKDIEDFATFCLSLGWIRCKPTNAFEVLRMNREVNGRRELEWLIVHRRQNAQHATTWGISAQMAEAFVRSKKSDKKGKSKPKPQMDLTENSPVVQAEAAPVPVSVVPLTNQWLDHKMSCKCRFCVSAIPDEIVRMNVKSMSRKPLGSAALEAYAAFHKTRSEKQLEHLMDELEPSRLPLIFDQLLLTEMQLCDMIAVADDLQDKLELERARA